MAINASSPEPQGTACAPFIGSPCAGRPTSRYVSQHVASQALPMAEVLHHLDTLCHLLASQTEAAMIFDGPVDYSDVLAKFNQRINFFEDILVVHQSWIELVESLAHGAGQINEKDSTAK